jgi:hypothetical protein
MATYRRREEIEAVEATHPGMLNTPDGPRPYLPGEFIVSTRRGENYIVKPAEFHRLWVLAMPPEGR